MRCSIPLIFACALISFGIKALAGDVIYSEDFEATGTLPSGWYSENFSSNWVLDSNYSNSGNRSLKLSLPEDNSTAEDTATYSNFISVEPGSVVRVSGYIKTNQVVSSTAKYTASIELAGTHTAEILGEGFKTTDGYIYLEKTIRLGYDTKLVKLFLRGYGPAGNVWFDDLLIERVSLPKELDVELYGRWRFNGNLNDSSGNGRDLVSIGSGGSPVVDDNGYTGQSCFFDNGVEGYSQVLYPGVIDIKDIDGLTLTAWINPSFLLSGFSTLSPHTIARLYNSNSTDDILDFRIRDNKLDVYYRRPVANNFSNFTIPVNQWSFVAVTQSQTEISVYLNDQKQIFDIDAGSNYNRLILGSASSNIARGLNGFLDEVRFYNRSLSSDQIRDVFGNADLNRDRIVNYYDLACFNDNDISLITGSFIGDINDDGLFDTSDIILMAAQWLQSY
ncbi:MAG: LamG-like jellyroll fold domain-containing protein [Sedimentisphaeraceae bacterium JB056]